MDASAFVADLDLIHALQEHSVPISCETDRLLFRQDDPATGIYILREGAATITMRSVTGQTIFSIPALPNSLLGLPALVSDRPYSLEVIALAGAQVSFIGRADFFALMQAEPALSVNMLRVLAAEVRTARQALF